jgi:hypothetical protein
MIHLPLKQGSDEWRRAHLGIPSASQFHRIITPTGKLSAQAKGYMHGLIAERVLGEFTSSDWSSALMDRGTEMEAQAAAWYEFTHNLETEIVGFCLTDDLRVGCSPDRFVGTDGMVEIKCPSAAVHVGYLLGDVKNEYKPQAQGQLWVTDRKWVDLVSFNPLLPPVVVRFPRDDDYIAGMAKAVGEFCAAADQGEQTLRAMMKKAA